MRLTSANSISLGRLLPQLAYHAHAAFLAGGLDLVVPTGNLGNALAAVWARALGAPIGDVVLATNANRVLPDYFAIGRRTVRGPASPPLPTRWTSATRATSSGCSGPSRPTGSADARLSTEAVDDREIEDVLRGAERRYARVFCPHTATAVRALERRRKAGRGRWAAVATAHPAKFETRGRAAGRPLRCTVPPALAALLARPASAEPLDADDAAFKRWLLALAPRADAGESRTP